MKRKNAGALAFVPLVNFGVLILLLFRNLPGLTPKRLIRMAASIFIPGIVIAVVYAGLEAWIESETVLLVLSSILYMYCAPLAMSLFLLRGEEAK